MANNIRTYILYGLTAIFTMFVLIHGARTLNQQTPHFCDEANWVALTSFYDIFIERDFENPQWHSFWGYDHPQFAKYIYGFALTSWNADFSASRDALIGHYFAEERTCMTTPVEPFEPYIVQMRNITTVLVVGSFLALAIVGILLSRLSIITLISPVFMLSHPLSEYLIVATSDVFYICFFLISLIFFLLYVPRKKYIYFVWSAVAIGLSLISKLTGLIYVVSYGLYMCAEMVWVRRWKAGLFKILVFGGIVTGIWFGSNPTLYYDSYNGSMNYFQQQAESVLIQQQQYEEWQRTSLPERTVISYAKIFPVAQSFPSALIHIMRLGLFLVGIWYSFRRSAQGSMRHQFIIVISFSSSLLLLLTLYLPWDRYLLPLVMSAMIFEILGLHAIYTWTTQKISGTFRHFLDTCIC